MPSGAVGEEWAQDSWDDTAWDQDAWGETGESSGIDIFTPFPPVGTQPFFLGYGRAPNDEFIPIRADSGGVVNGVRDTVPRNIGSRAHIIMLGETVGGDYVPVSVTADGLLDFTV